MSRPKQSLTKQLAASLQSGQLETLYSGKPEIIPPLLKLAQTEHNPTLVARAQQVLGQLQKQETREALCRLLVQEDNPFLLEIVRQAEYRPAEFSQRALFYFLTEQWEAYEALDFDCRLLRVTYQTADPTLRRRISAKVQKAGRLEYLSIITGWDYHSTTNLTAPTFTTEEIELMVAVLTYKEEWQRLWQLVALLPVQWSIEVVKRLANSNWQPLRAEDRLTFEHLKVLVRATSQGQDRLKKPDTEQLFNQAILRAKVTVAGRVKALAFASHAPLLAIATGNSKVVLWNLHTARQEVVLEGFKYPVGALTFLPDGTLLCGERSQTNAGVCKIYGFKNGQRFEIGQHQQAVTSLQLLNTGQLVSAGRDGQVSVWDLSRRSKIGTLAAEARAWSPTLCLPPGREQLAILHNQIELYELAADPAFASYRCLASSGIDYSNSLKHAAFSPDGQLLVTGRFNGELVLWSLNSSGQLQPAPLGFKHLPRRDTTVEGLATLQDPALLLMATSDGAIQYFDWQTKLPLGEIHSPGERLSSMQLSPDQSFLAVGDRDQSFTLWDVRLLALSRLLTQPLATARPSYLNTFRALEAMQLELPSALAHQLKFIELVLQHRFRYEIELVELAIIQPGDFDIELEG